MALVRRLENEQREMKKDKKLVEKVKSKKNPLERVYAEKI
jgi:hypothetical protein